MGGVAWINTGSNFSSITPYVDSVVNGSPSTDGEWRHYVFTGVSFQDSAWTSIRLVNNGTLIYGGDIDDFRVYDRILSEAEVKKNYKAGMSLIK